MSKKPQLLDSTVVAQSRLFDIESVHLRFSNGEERFFECIKGRTTQQTSVMIVPMLDEDTILLVREYGAAIDDYVINFPKGAIEEEEDLLVTANRELKEETGYGANDLSTIARLTASPAYVRSTMNIVLAKDLYEQVEVGDEPEPMEVIPWSLNNIDALCAHAEFHDALSMAALFLIQKERYGR